MAFSVIAHLGEGSPDGGTFTTAGIDTTGANLLVLAYVDDQGATAGFTDSKSNSWTAGTVENSPDLGQRVQFHHVYAPTVGAAHTFTSTGLGATIFVLAVSGARATPADGENGAGSLSASSLATGSLTPSHGRALLVTITSPFADPGPSEPSSIDGGFTILDTVGFSSGNHYAGALAYLIQTTVAAANPTWTFSGAGSVAQRIAAFRAEISSGHWWTRWWARTNVSAVALMPIVYHQRTRHHG